MPTFIVVNRTWTIKLLKERSSLVGISKLKPFTYLHCILAELNHRRKRQSPSDLKVDTGGLEFRTKTAPKKPRPDPEKDLRNWNLEEVASGKRFLQFWEMAWE